MVSHLENRYVQLVIWLSLGALIGAVAQARSRRRLALPECLAAATLGSLIGGSIAWIAAGPETVLARLLAPPSALVGGVIMLAVVIRGMDAHASARR